MAPPWPTAGEDLTLERAAAYLAVGADGSFVPGAVDPGTVELLVDAVDGLLNVMAGSATLPSPSRPHPSWSAAPRGSCWTRGRTTRRPTGSTTVS
ncbi:isocitrate lyase/phosphoenolpyruvate mutase family protein [Streptomyces canus]|uniref:isocitrate lyase/phosphoenolpyruvate mutase family protein n=1 Tax=Streptomyces canus TaxID=58343 RepID=UPI002E29AAF4|nr:isocitrate lyase/phosphoenolpyruvate mutase family protein [Streptomyces canus]